MGGFDVIEYPFSDLEIQGAVLRAIHCFKERAGKSHPPIRSSGRNSAHSEVTVPHAVFEERL